MKKNINIYWVAVALFVVLVVVWFLTNPSSGGKGGKDDTAKQNMQATEASTESVANADSYQSEAAESNAACQSLLLI